MHLKVNVLSFHLYKKKFFCYIKFFNTQPSSLCLYYLVFILVFCYMSFVLLVSIVLLWVCKTTYSQFASVLNIDPYFVLGPCQHYQFIRIAIISPTLFWRLCYDLENYLHFVGTLMRQWVIQMTILCSWLLLLPMLGLNIDTLLCSGTLLPQLLLEGQGMPS